ncbi:hypothetical protein HC928_03545 [bacterium]|nr:hypothetical protein [bacterium]
MRLPFRIPCGMDARGRPEPANTAEPTPTRLLVVARYESEQEFTREGFLSTDVERVEPIATTTPIISTVTPLPARDLLYVELVEAATSPDGYLVTELRRYNGQFEPVTIYPDDHHLRIRPQVQATRRPARGLRWNAPHLHL